MGLQNKLTKSHEIQNTPALTDPKFWDEFWSPNPFEGDWEAQLWSRVLQHQFHNYVKPLIDKNGFKTFLDVGIGDGILSLYFSKVIQ